MKTPNSTH